MVLLADLLSLWRLCSKFRRRLCAPRAGLLDRCVSSVSSSSTTAPPPQDELSRLEYSIGVLLNRLEQHSDEVASHLEEECVVCMSSKASMQTFPCCHMVLCRRCFIRTIQLFCRQPWLIASCPFVVSFAAVVWFVSVKNLLAVEWSSGPRGYLPLRPTLNAPDTHFQTADRSIAVCGHPQVLRYAPPQKSLMD
ncbi:unnamed protein product [Soboliphyme baturini]|uniref:RING-type domain-containing protein n=1 Tax=Soboliphyme baturini TaxID=241478 RepID=A0A183IK24_9BILA|nr:unnamed protein product [Soboliphyme baturini]